MSDTFIFSEGFDSFSMSSPPPIFYGGTNITVFPQTIAPVYSPTSTYSVGDYCMYEGQLYQCNTAISTAEAWNPSHWSGVTVVSLTNGIATDLADFEAEVNAEISDIGAKTLPSGGSAGQYLKKYSSTDNDVGWHTPDANEITWLDTENIPIFNTSASFTMQFTEAQGATATFPYYESIDVSNGTPVLHGKTTTTLLNDMPSTVYDYMSDTAYKVEKTTPTGYVILKYYAFSYVSSAPATYTEGSVAKALDDLNNAVGSTITTAQIDALFS